MTMKTIVIRCTAAVNLQLRELTPLQGELKELNEVNFEKLKRSILKHGITFPFFVWQSEGQNFILDGTQRDRVLKRMADEGYGVPPLPCALIQAKDRKDAAEKILLISSQYRRVTDEGVLSTVGKIAIALLLMMPSSNATLGQYPLMVSGKIFQPDSDLRLRI
jgi:ParB/Sulfiredoxin domain